MNCDTLAKVDPYHMFWRKDPLPIRALLTGVLAALAVVLLAGSYATMRRVTA